MSSPPSWVSPCPPPGGALLETSDCLESPEPVAGEGHLSGPPPAELSGLLRPRGEPLGVLEGMAFVEEKNVGGATTEQPPVFGFPFPLLSCGSCSRVTGYVAAGPGPGLFPSTPWGCCFFSPDIAEGIITSGKFLGFPEVWTLYISSSLSSKNNWGPRKGGRWQRQVPFIWLFG